MGLNGAPVPDTMKRRPATAATPFQALFKRGDIELPGWRRDPANTLGRGRECPARAPRNKLTLSVVRGFRGAATFCRHHRGSHHRRHRSCGTLRRHRSCGTLRRHCSCGTLRRYCSWARTREGPAGSSALALDSAAPEPGTVAPERCIARLWRESLAGLGSAASPTNLARTGNLVRPPGAWSPGTSSKPRYPG
jgi:hypothetical protein